MLFKHFLQKNTVKGDTYFTLKFGTERMASSCLFGVEITFGQFLRYTDIYSISKTLNPGREEGEKNFPLKVPFHVRPFPLN